MDTQNDRKDRPVPKRTKYVFLAIIATGILGLLIGATRCCWIFPTYLLVTICLLGWALVFITALIAYFCEMCDGLERLFPLDFLDQKFMASILRLLLLGGVMIIAAIQSTPLIKALLNAQ